MNVLVAGGAGVSDYIHVVDLANCCAEPAKSAELLGRKAEKTLGDMCRDAGAGRAGTPRASVRSN